MQLNAEHVFLFPIPSSTQAFRVLQTQLETFGARVSMGDVSFEGHCDVLLRDHGATLFVYDVRHRELDALGFADVDELLRCQIPADAADESILECVLSHIRTRNHLRANWRNVQV